jgi:hypothetical protein
MLASLASSPRCQETFRSINKSLFPAAVRGPAPTIAAMDDGERAQVPVELARQLFSMCGNRLRRRWFRAPAKLPRKPRVKRQRRPWAHWTDTDDYVIAIFGPQEAAALLGRSVQAIYWHRSRKTVGKANGDRQARNVVRRVDDAWGGVVVS